MRNYAERARTLVGTRFRPQGRSDDGLDCVGVILMAFDLNADAAPQNYRLRGDHRSTVERGMLQQFRRIRTEKVRAGDVILMRVAEDQVHLGIRTNDGFVQAHAGIGCVVETPGLPKWPILSAYRKRARAKGI